MAGFWVFIGAGFGAILRWLLSIYIPLVYGWLPLGTLTANAIGGLLIGIYLGSQHLVGPDMRLFLVTGFLGGLTTFSTFSAETITLFSEGRAVAGLTLMTLHLVLSLGLTAVGFWAAKTVLYGG